MRGFEGGTAACNTMTLWNNNNSERVGKGVSIGAREDMC